MPYPMAACRGGRSTSPLGAAPPAGFVFDTFTDADQTILDNHTGEVGATWTDGGDIFIDNNSLNVGNTFGADTAYASGVPATAEYDVEISVVKGGGLIFVASVLGRVKADLTDYYELKYSEAAGVGELTLVKRLASMETELDFWAGEIGATATIKLELRNAAKKGYVDGVERVSSANNDVTDKGFAGVGVYSSDATDGLFITTLTATDA